MGVAIDRTASAIAERSRENRRASRGKKHNSWETWNMNKSVCNLMLALSVAANAIGGEIISSARSEVFSIDTVTVTNSTLTVNVSMLPLRLDYSSSLWNDVNCVDDGVRITANRIIASEETVFEENGEGSLFWTPTIAGVYSISLTSSNGITLSKTFDVVAATVMIERDGYNFCKLTASDGVSEIRYTTDGTDPTADSPLYTEPFEVPPSKLSFVRAATFAVGCPQGEVAMAYFKPVASFVSVAQMNCAIDNSGETKMVGYDAIQLPYDVEWEGDASSSVELRVDGELLAERTGSGEVAWMPEREGLTTLTLRTVNGSGGTLAEYSAQYDVVPRNVTITDGATPLNELYPGLCHWITNITIDANVESLGKRVDLNAGNWGPVDADGTGKTVAYRSNTISHNGNTAMSMVVEGPLEWSFKWKVSSEGNWDWLRWSLDGVEKSKISGTGGGWQEVQCVIPEGDHTILWAYTKDGSASSGDDCGWVAFDLPQNASTLFEECSGLTGVTMPYRFRSQFGDTLNGCLITYIAAVYVEVDGEVVATNYVQCGSALGELPAVQSREGYTAAFYTARTGGNEIAADTVVNEDMTVYVRWFVNGYTITFDANGGMGGKTVSQDYGTELVAPMVTRTGYTFAGWFPEVPATVPADDTTYVAQWVTMGEAVGMDEKTRSIPWTVVEGDEWTVDFITTHDGDASLTSGEVPAAEVGGCTNTTLTTTVYGEGNGSFWWKVSCEGMDDELGEWYDYAVFAVDGEEVARIAGDSGWQKVEYEVAGNGFHELSWTFTRDDWDAPDADWENALWLDEFSWTKVLTLADVASVDEASAMLPWTTGGDAEWTIETDASAADTKVGPPSAKSGAVTSGQSSWIEVSIEGPGTAEFMWNVQGGIYRGSPYAYAKVEVDGVQQAQEYNTEGWTNKTLEIDGEGTHTIRWTYLRTTARSVVGDCAWLDGFSWTPPCGHPTTNVVNALEATCTEAGYTGDKVCAECGEVIETGSSIPALGHVEGGGVINAHAATCTGTGYTGDKVCEVCGEVFETGSTIPALGHIEGEGVVTKEPTTAEEGVMTYYCTRCGAVLRTEAIAKIVVVPGSPTFTGEVYTFWYDGADDCGLGKVEESRKNSPTWRSEYVEVNGVKEPALHGTESYAFPVAIAAGETFEAEVVHGTSTDAHIKSVYVMTDAQMLNKFKDSEEWLEGENESMDQLWSGGAVATRAWVVVEQNNVTTGTRYPIDLSQQPVVNLQRGNNAYYNNRFYNPADGNGGLSSTWTVSSYANALGVSLSGVRYVTASVNYTVRIKNGAVFSGRVWNICDPYNTPEFDDGDLLEDIEDAGGLEEAVDAPGLFLVLPEAPAAPSVVGDSDATVTGDAVSGYTVKPSAESGAVEVTIPGGVDAAKVTVEVPPTVESVKANGAAIRIVKGGHDITELLDIPETGGTRFVASATVKEAIVKEAIDKTKGAEVDLKASDPSITTAPTRPGLTYPFSEGATLEGMTQKAEKQGDGEPWTPPVTVKGGASGFYSIGVGK